MKEANLWRERAFFVKENEMSIHSEMAGNVTF